ncbi:MAG TPA: hypothetical protein EYO85_03870, partial [Rhodospirillales bacterium]|nr:hypothetical protein [Rhodospirillales bacterium]
KPVAMEQGLTFAIREGGRTIGSGVVAEALTDCGSIAWQYYTPKRFAAAVKQGKDPLDVGEEALMKRLGQAASLDRWFEVWEKINRLLVKTDLINLSRKQVLLNVFLTLQNAVRP